MQWKLTGESSSDSKAVVSRKPESGTHTCGHNYELDLLN